MRQTVAVIILAENEEANIVRCLQSVMFWPDEVYVVDGLSKDRTVELAQAPSVTVIQHEFRDIVSQRTWAVGTLPIQSDWIFFLDADEFVSPSFQKELSEKLSTIDDNVVALYVRFDLYFLRKKFRFIKHPHFIRIFRRGAVRYVSKDGFKEKPVVDGATACIHAPIEHNDQKSFKEWLVRQSEYAALEARHILEQEASNSMDEKVHNNSSEVKGILDHIMRWVPLRMQPFLFFAYRYVIQFGFLDGYEGFIFLFFQSLYRLMLVNAYVIEGKRGMQLRKQ